MSASRRGGHYQLLKESLRRLFARSVEDRELADMDGRGAAIARQDTRSENGKGDDERTDLAALLKRLEAASGPDRDLDADLALALHCLPEARPFYSSELLELDSSLWEKRPHGYLAHPHWSYRQYRPVASSREFTGSIDAAIVLAECVLGSACSWSATEHPVAARVSHDGGSYEASGGSLPLALCTAIVKAKLAETDLVERDRKTAAT